MDSRWARVARGWTAAGFATFVAAFSHTVVDGAGPSAFGILVSLVISGALCTMLAGRTMSLWRLTISVGASQAMFHGLFGSLGTPVVVGHRMGAMPMDAASAPHHAGAVMWLAHAIAAVITVVALRYAGSAFWGVADTARLLLTRLAALFVPVTPTARSSATIADRNDLPRDLTRLLSPMRHRGPPAQLV